MAGFFDRYATDRNLEEAGVEVDYGDGLKITIRRLNSKFSREIRRKLEKPFAGQYRGREMPESLSEQLLNKQIAQAIVVAWEGVPDPEDKAGTKMLECTPENVLMMVERFPDFRDDILTAAMEKSTFQREDVKEQEKN